MGHLELSCGAFGTGLGSNRKGAVGDHQHLFTAEHVKRFDAMYRSEFTDSECDLLLRLTVPL